MKKFIGVASVATGVALVLGGCASGSGSDADSGGDSTFNILMVTSTSGPAGIYGTRVVRGAQIAADQLNADGGIDGREVDIEVKDMQSDTSVGVTLLQQSLSSGAKPDLVFTGLFGADAQAMHPITTQNEVLAFNYGQVEEVNGDPESYPYSFTMNPASGLPGRVAAEAMYQDGLKTAATIAPNAEQALEVVKAFKDEFEKLGGKVVGEVVTEPQAADVSPDFERAYSLEPDAIFGAGQGAALLYLEGNHTMGNEIPFYGEGSFSDDFRSQGIAEDYFDNVWAQSNPLNLTMPTERSERQQKFYEGWLGSGADEADNLNPGVGATGYDMVMSVAAAVEQADSVAAADVAAALENLQGDIIWARGYPIKYSEDNHHIQPVAGEPLPWVTFPLTTPYVHEDGGYYDFQGSLVQ